MRPNARLVLFLVLWAGWCVPYRLAAATREEAVRSVFAQFRQLEPPFDAAQAQRVFGGAKWLQKAKVSLIQDVVGYIPLASNPAEPCFYVQLTRPHHLSPGDGVYLRTTKDIANPAALVRFFHGQAVTRARVLEYSLVHDAPWPTDKTERHDGRNTVLTRATSTASEPEVPADFLPAEGTLTAVLQTPVSGSFHVEVAGIVVGKLCAQLPTNSFYKADATRQKHPTFTGDFQAVPLRSALYRIARQSHIEIGWVEQPNGEKTISARE